MVFNFDLYASLFKKFIGKRQKRHIARKEVIINDPDYHDMLQHVEQLIAEAKAYRQEIRRPSLIKYMRFICRHVFTRKRDEHAEEISRHLEYIVEVLSNTKDRKVLVYLNSLPILDTHSFRFYRRRRGDMRGIIEYGGMLKDRINEIIYGQNQIQ